MNDSEKFVRAIDDGDKQKAKDLLEKILKDKVELKIKTTLSDK